jgi:hypothetical protein
MFDDRTQVSMRAEIIMISPEIEGCQKPFCRYFSIPDL